MINLTGCTAFYYTTRGKRRKPLEVGYVVQHTQGIVSVEWTDSPLGQHYHNWTQREVLHHWRAGWLVLERDGCPVDLLQGVAVCMVTYHRDGVKVALPDNLRKSATLPHGWWWAASGRCFVPTHDLWMIGMTPQQRERLAGAAYPIDFDLDVSRMIA